MIVQRSKHQTDSWNGIRSDNASGTGRAGRTAIEVARANRPRRAIPSALPIGLIIVSLAAVFARAEETRAEKTRAEKPLPPIGHSAPSDEMPMPTSVPWVPPVEPKLNTGHTNPGEALPTEPGTSPAESLDATATDDVSARTAAAPSTRRFDGSVPVNPPGLVAPDQPLPSMPASEESDGEAVDLPLIDLRWQPPLALTQRLEKLKGNATVDAWIDRVDSSVARLGAAFEQREFNGSLPTRHAALANLRETLAAAEPIAASLDDAELSTELRRAAHALRRRTDVWTHVSGLHETPPEADTGADRELTVGAIAAIDRITAFSPQGPAWREYLMLDVLRQWADGTVADDNQRATEAVERALRRLSEAPLTMDQRQFLERRPLVELRAQLRREVEQPVDPSLLLIKLERYEMTGWASEAERVAADRRRLAVSKDPKRRMLAAQLERHYRNANIRVSMSENLLNRLMPDREPETAAVRDVVHGLPVRGRSTTQTRVGVKMLPDPRRVTMALEIQGEVRSLTTSTSGPATFWNNSQAWYVADKPLEIDLTGIHMWPARVRVSNALRLRDVQTDLDGLPLIGSLVERVARSQHAQSRDEVNAEIRRKVYRKAKQRIDTESEQRLKAVSARLRENVLEPMHRLRLDPTMIDADTNRDGFIMRLRLAGEDQLGSHTPRPREPEGALAGFQMHQSAINNSLSRLELAGQTFTLAELKGHLEERLGRDDLLHVPPDQHDVEITFAENDPLRISCEDGKLGISLSIAQLKKGFRSWKDFRVQAFYRPEPDGLSAELVRDGVIQLIGELRMGGQIALRGVFARTFSKRRPIRLTPERLIENPKMAGVEVTQLVIDDGWVGLALGEKPDETEHARYPLLEAMRGH